MTAAESGWLDLRVPFDDAARQCALPLLDKAVDALPEDSERPLVIIDLGAGIGNSMRWFDRHLRRRLPDRRLHRVLVDSDAAALDIAAQRFGTAVRTVATPIASLPGVAAEALAEVAAEAPAETSAASPRPADLLITGSALLDVLTRDDMVVIAETLARFSGVGLFLLSVSGRWKLTPSHLDDAVLDEAFSRHQRRDSRLGTHAVATLAAEACRIGGQVDTSNSFWDLKAPRDAGFLTRFLTERVDAAIEADPRLATIGRAWLDTRLHGGLEVVVDHTDVLIDATVLDSPRTGEPQR